MMQDDAELRSREAVAEELRELAVRRYGREAAEGLEQHIAEAASAIDLLGEVPFGTWSDEPDFLVAAERREG